MNKYLIVSIILFLSLIAITSFDTTTNSKSDIGTSEFFHEGGEQKVPLYYNIDNPNQILINEEGEYKEVKIINGNS